MFNNEFLFFCCQRMTRRTQIFFLCHQTNRMNKMSGAMYYFCQRMTRRTRIFFCHQTNRMNQMAGAMCYFCQRMTRRTRIFFCVLLRLLLFVYSYLVHLVHLVIIFKISSCSSCSPLATPSSCPMFHAPFLYLHRWKVRGVFP